VTGSRIGSNVSCVFAATAVMLGACAGPQEAALQEGRGSPTAASTTGPAVSVQLPIPLRLQWPNDHGYCGETSMQAIGLYYGAWISQDLARRVAGGEVLLGVNAKAALEAFSLDPEEWQSSSRPQFQGFAVWTKNHLASGHPVIFGAYLTDGFGDPDYDHIMPATGIRYESLASYAASDELTYTDNYGHAIVRPIGTLSATRVTCGYSSAQGGCIPSEIDYGVAVKGIIDRQGATLPVSIAVPGDSEPNVTRGGSPVPMNATVTASKLTARATYALLRYDNRENVPSNATAAGFLSSRYDYRVDFTAEGPTWSYSDPVSFRSDGGTFYRVVPR
jgi:hypothetical protein